MQYFGIRDLREKIGDYAHEADAGVISVISRNGVMNRFNNNSA